MSRITQSETHVILRLRAQGLSLWQIGKETGRCMEAVRQVILRHIKSGLLNDDEARVLIHEHEALPPGHPVVMGAMWRGLEKWRHNAAQKP